MKIIIYKKFKDISNSEEFSLSIPVFASQQYADYLKVQKNYNTIWISGINNNGSSYFIPFATMKKGPFRKGMFLTAVISKGIKEVLDKEKEFLDKVVDLVKSNKLCDWIQQGPNWAIFNTYPSGAIYAPFGTYRINMEDKTEEELYMKLYGKVRSRINKTTREKLIEIKKNEENFDDSIQLIDSTLRSAKIESFTKNKLNTIRKHLKDNVVVYTTYSNNEPQSSLIYFYNQYSMYGMYAGSKRGAVQGATESLIWQAIKEAKKKKIKYFDFVGARINPDENSKLYRIQKNKYHFGSQLKEGYMWKMVLNRPKYFLYTFYVRTLNLLRGKKNKGDIIDQETERLGMKNSIFFPN